MQIEPQDWRELLPDVRGSYRFDEPLAKYVWFKVGGPADILYSPADEEDLAAFLRSRPLDVPLTVLGAGSNILIRDGGIRGITVRLGRAFSEITVAKRLITAGGMAMDVNVARTALEYELGGLEFLRGIPGSIGGAVRMNAGAYGGEIKDHLVDIRTVDFAGVVREFSGADLNLSYRHSSLPPDQIVLSVRLQGEPMIAAEITARMDEIMEVREESQPVRARTGGSTFKNPDQARAWELIDQAGCRGLRYGNAQVSEQHCNFLINNGSATAKELEDLGEIVRRKVLQHSGIQLDWEIRRIGEHAEQEEDAAL